MRRKAACLLRSTWVWLALLLVNLPYCWEQSARLRARALRGLGLAAVVLPQGPASGSCRICHGEGACFSVCGCSGSMAAVHLSCLEDWRQRRGFPSRCEICQASYSVARQPWGCEWRRRPPP